MTQPAPEIPFQTIAGRLAMGIPLPPGWKALPACDLLILVGVTGVGKSTTLQALARTGVQLSHLPDRRELTDTLIIPAMQAAMGQAASRVDDRSTRFAYTRRFRELYAGGMAQALTWLCAAPDLAAQPLLFDGLRGENEVRFALDAFPGARFVLLDAPDAVRVARLLRRRDSFDKVLIPPSSAPADDLFGNAASLFTPDERENLVQLVLAGAASADDLRAKVHIVAEERRDYDPAAARRALEVAGNHRALIVDTTAAPAATVAEQIARWLDSRVEM